MQDFSLRFEMPRNGWMLIELIKQQESFSMAVSYIYQNAPSELIRCLVNVLHSRDDGMIWYLEPNEYHFEFKTSQVMSRFQINERLAFQETKTHFEVEMPSFELVLAFWRGLRCLESQILDDEFQEGWKTAFPAKELSKLTEQIRDIKRNRK